MSRTIRRKNVGNWDKQWYVEDLERVGDDGWGWKWVKKTGKALKKANALYHSDRTTTMEHVPKWFRQNLNQEYRSKSKQVLRKLNSNPELAEEINFPRLRDTALWNWW